MTVSRTFRLCPVASCLLGALSPAAELPKPPYRDPDHPMESRIRDLVSRMTLEEKAGLLSNATPGIPRLGIPKYDWWNEGLHGVARAGHATVFRQAIGLAAMWDENLQHQIALVIGIEARAKFNSCIGTPDPGGIYRGLTFGSPNINIFRDPLWGRGPGNPRRGPIPHLAARTRLRPRTPGRRSPLPVGGGMRQTLRGAQRTRTAPAQLRRVTHGRRSLRDLPAGL